MASTRKMGVRRRNQFDGLPELFSSESAEKYLPVLRKMKTSRRDISTG